MSQAHPEVQGLSRFAQQLLVGVLALVFLVITIYLLREFAVILKPLLIAVFLGYLVVPAHLWLVRRGINRPLAAVVLVLIISLMIYGVGTLIYSNIETVQQNWPGYQARWQRIWDGLTGSLPESWQKYLHPPTEEPVNWARVELSSLFGNFLSFLSAALMVVVYLAFLLAERSSLPRRLENAYGSERAANIMSVLGNIGTAISQYVAVKTFLSIVAGVLTTVVLLIFGVDFAFTWGTLAFLFNYIPYLGSLIATLLPILLALVQFDSWWQAAVIGVLLVGMQEFLGMVVEPKMAGAKLGVSPLLIILSLAFWGVVWGIVGMILAVPLLVAIKIVLDSIPATQPVAKLMGSG
jgi:predicted PurR-regulated permease PerM